MTRLIRDRIFVKVMRRFCEEHEIEIAELSYDWIYVLRREGDSRIIVGYDIGVNSSAAKAVAGDKAGTYDVLKLLGVPAVRHEMFIAPEFMGLVGRGANWESIMECHRRNCLESVVKPNEGTGGMNVVFVDTMGNLERAVQSIFSRERSLAIAPYVSVEREVRAYISFGEVLCLYEKVIPTVIGNGRSQVWQLCVEQIGAESLTRLFSSDDEGSPLVRPTAIVAKGEAVRLGWKHNLALGNRLRILDPSSYSIECELALSAAKAVGLNFGSVDVVEACGELAVLEVNSGVMFESAYYSGSMGYGQIEAIYRSGLCRLFSL